MDPPSIYKSETGRTAIMQWYESQIDRLTGPVGSRRVDTSFGRTHLLVAGPQDNRPLILLHGMNMNAAAMTSAIRELCVGRRVFVIDIIGMPGKSAGTRPSRRDTDYPRWLGEVMDAAKIERADFLGESFGGWLILKLAAYRPDRVRKAIFLESGGFVPFSLRGQVVAGLAALRHMMRGSEQSWLQAAQPFFGPGIAVDPCFAELLGLTFQHIRLDIEVRGLPTLGRGNLKGFHGPAFVSYGEHDLFFDAPRAVRKAKQALSRPVVTEIVKGEGHKISKAASRARYRRVRTFLNESDRF